MEIIVTEFTISTEARTNSGEILVVKIDAEFYTDSNPNAMEMHFLVTGTGAQEIAGIVTAAVRKQLEAMVK